MSETGAQPSQTLISWDAKVTDTPSAPQPGMFEHRFNPPLVMPEAGYYMFTIGNGVLAVHGPGRGVDDRGNLVATYHLGDNGWHLIVEVPEHPGDLTS